MSEQTQENVGLGPNQQTNAAAPSGDLKLSGLYAFKMGMMTVYGEDGSVIPVTALKYDPMYVSQVKTKEKDGYSAVQVAFKPKPARTSNSAELAKMRKAGFENSAYHCREIRQELPEGVQIGQKVAIESLEKGTIVKVVANSKGRGFSGTVKRHNFAGGPGAHGSKFHRQPGSMGMRTWPGRILKGRKLPGQFGNEQTTTRKLTIVDVIPEENVILVKGSVPGGTNTLVKIVRE
jgi:large subunit ribosomal protein L3